MPAQPTRRPTDDHDESFPVGLLGPGHDSGGLLSSFLTRIVLAQVFEVVKDRRLRIRALHIDTEMDRENWNIYR